ncbi:MAG TPA: hypothetical protein PLH72_17590 [Vicinamibacterales bacterium]|nr:hypothetical protein [Vicinamibacterales bacterium]
MASEASPRLLIAGDQPDVLEVLRLLLKPEDWRRSHGRTLPGGRLARALGLPRSAL